MAILTTNALACLSYPKETNKTLELIYLKKQKDNTLHITFKNNYSPNISNISIRKDSFFSFLFPFLLVDSFSITFSS